MLAATVRQAARRFGEAVVMSAPDGTLTYRQLDERSDRIAAGLRVRPGDRVVLRLPSGIAYLLAYAATAKCGAAVAGINSGLADGEQDRLVDLADPAVVLDSPDTVFALERSAPALDLDTDPARLAALVFTSGSTGLPRAAMFRDHQLAAIARLDSGGGWAERPGTPAFMTTHFAHVGMTTKLPWYLQRGLLLHVLPKWRADDVLRVVAEHRLPEIGGIPTQIALLVQAQANQQLDVTCVQRIVAGGAASSPTLIEAAQKAFGAEYVVRYSSTESGGCGLGTTTTDEALRGIGRPRPGIEAQVRDGELCLRTPTAMDGYWRDEEATAAALPDGWLHTGDLAVQQADGTFTLKGRRKEMYIRGGYNVYPAEVELELAQHPAVAACAVIPRADDTMGEVGVAVVVLRPDASATLADVRSFLAPRLARWKLPEQLLVVPELPLNGTHKLDRRAVARIVALASPR